MKSEYRLPNGTQLDGSSELEVFYTDSAGLVNGNIVQSNDLAPGTYSVTFESSLPPVVNLTVSLGVPALGLPATVGILVRSIGKGTCIDS